MQKLSLLICLLVSPILFSQNNELLIEETLVTDLSQSTLYSRLVEKSNNSVLSWKEEYQYIDSINIYKISYLSDGLKVNGYLVKPKQEGTYPCIVYNRGGSGKFGTLSDVHAAVFLGEIAKEGYIVIACQYRGNGGSEGKEEFGGSDINDVMALLDVLTEIKGADTSKIGMCGWSRGGMMTYLALTKTNKIKAAVVGGAVSDLFKLIEDRPKMEEEVVSKYIPNYKTNKESELKKRSAIKWVDKFKKDVPILMLHGGSDWRVKPDQSLKLALKMNEYKIPYKLIIYDGGSHSIKEFKKDVNSQVIKWFDRFLKKT